MNLFMISKHDSSYTEELWEIAFRRIAKKCPGKQPVDSAFEYFLVPSSSSTELES